MVRRRRTQNKPNSGKARPVDRKDASVKKWEKYTDIPMDEEDDFHASKDQILLDNDQDDEDDYGDEDEIFSLKGLARDDSEDEEDEEEEGVLESPTPSKKKSKKKKRKDISDSEESSSEEEEHWGKSKAAYYSSNAAQLESDDEEGQELELQEARRIQGKLLEHLSDDDYGIQDQPTTLDDPMDLDKFATIEVPLPTEKHAILRHLEKTNPEALALARDWDNVAHTLIKTRAKIESIQAAKPDAMSLGMLHLHYQTLLTYATTLAFYFHLRSSEKYASNPDALNSHPILSRLLTLKQSLATLEQLDFAASSDEEDDDLDDGEEDEDLESDEDEDDVDLEADAENLWSLARREGLEPDELAELLRDSSDASTSALPEPATDDDEDDLPSSPPRPKKKRKTAEKSSLPLFDVEEPDFSSLSSSSSKSKPSASSSSQPLDIYGEASSISTGDLADKQARKQSLRFYTSKLDSAAARRQAAREKIGGDDDIPYRERKKERELREAREAERRRARGELGTGGEDLGDEDGDVDMGGAEEGEDAYYKLVQKQAKDKKQKKKSEYDAAVAAAKQMDYELGDASEGPRALTRAILANKGLTPRRPKASKNPRVKKKLQHKKATQKVSSQKAVFKGGLKDTGGHYQGERTGISKVAKGIRLG